MILSSNLKLKVSDEQHLLLVESIEIYKKCVDAVLEFGFKHKTADGRALHSGTYYTLRKSIPTPPAAFVICARVKATADLKHIKTITKNKWDVKQPKSKKYSAITCDSNFCRINKETLSISTVRGRIKLPIVHNPFIKEDYKKFRRTFRLFLFRNNWYLTVFVEVKEPEKQPIKEILGIDRGINNIVVCSNNTFINSKHLKQVKGKYRYLRRKLQKKGTRSAKRLLKNLSKRENRFVRDTNHCISKQIINLPYDTFILEKLNIYPKKKNGKRFNTLLGNWSWKQLEAFLLYKAILTGKNIEYVDARYTSQKCSNCNHTERNNRNGIEFKCKQCSFMLHADLNAARNIKNNYIVSMGTSYTNRLLSTSHTDQSSNRLGIQI